MKKITRAARLRFDMLVLLLVCAITAAFLFNPNDRAHHAEQYDPLSGTAADRSLAPDELEPYSYTVSLPEIERRRAAWSCEAEDAPVPEGSIISWSRSGYSGRGYVTHLKNSTESAFVIPLTVPATQHYAVTICAAADSEVTNALRVNGNLLSPFTLIGGDSFIRITFYSLFINKSIFI